MKINIVVKPNSRKEGVESLPDGSLRISVNAPAQEGRANEAVIRVLADHFAVRASMVRIIIGARGRKKVVEIDPS